MNPRPIIRPEAAKEVPSQNNGTSSDHFIDDPVDELTNLMKMLANAGGGSVSWDLALDLVLNEFVQQAREATRAAGAAIALDRDGEMICRASTGNAPELGARVDTMSGLSAAALKTGTFQECVDTQNDPRVDADGCRQLQLRSMLLVPIAAEGAPVGLIEIFSPQPNNFGSEDLKTLQQLAGKIAVSITQAQAEPDPIAENVTAAPVEGVFTSPQITADAGQSISDPQRASAPTEEPRTHEVLSSALFVLVIAAAVLLGVVIGVREFAKRSAGAKAGERPVTTRTSQSGPQSGPGEARTEAPRAPAPVQQPQASGVPPGGLIVTQNGKVIYRAGPAQNAVPTSHDSQSSAARLIHRVAPQYPEAAKSQRIQGPVVLEAQVLPDGSVGDVTVVSGDPLLAQAASTAVKQWKYAPYRLNGRPVDRLEQITVTFNLPSS